MSESENTSCPGPVDRSIALPLPEDFLGRDDWLAFAITTFISLSVYVGTLSPSIDLGTSGTLITGARYLGVPQVPGYPLWVVYSWLFSVVLPVSNIAWRMNVASAVAAALTCGMSALLASRFIGDILRNQPKTLLDAGESKAIRLICAIVGGLALCFDHGFWAKAVIANPWPLSVLFFVVTLALFLRWQHSPEKTRWFYAAVFMLGITLTNSQALAPSALGFEMLILFTDLKLARDIFAATTLLIVAILLNDHFEFLPGPATELQRVITTNTVIETIGILTLLLTLALTWTTRRLFTRARAIIAAMLVFALGLTPYLLIPIFSMGNPPINWGYPRTVEGFVHVITRGQYEHIYPADSLGRFSEISEGYLKVTLLRFGFFYVIAALIPFFMIQRLQKIPRQSFAGLFFVFLSLSLFMLFLLNPSADRNSQEMHELFYSPSHLILAIFTGCGLAIIGARIGSIGRSKIQNEHEA